MGDRKERWHVGKEVPLALVLMFFMQTAGAVWYASKMDSRISSNTQEITENKAHIAEIKEDLVDFGKVLNEQAVTFGRMEVALINIEKTLEVLSNRFEFRGGQP